MHDIIWIHMTSCTFSKLSHHAVTFTHTLLMSSHPAYLSSHAVQLSYYLQCIDFSTFATCVVSNPLHAWHHMNSMWYHNKSLWHRKTLLMTSPPHISWHHTHCRLQDIHSICDIKATVTMTRNLLCFSHCTHGIWHLTCWMKDNTMTVSDMMLNVSL